MLSTHGDSELETVATITRVTMVTRVSTITRVTMVTRVSTITGVTMIVSVTRVTDPDSGAATVVEKRRVRGVLWTYRTGHVAVVVSDTVVLPGIVPDTVAIHTVTVVVAPVA